MIKFGQGTLEGKLGELEGEKGRGERTGELLVRERGRENNIKGTRRRKGRR